MPPVSSVRPRPALAPLSSQPAPEQGPYIKADTACVVSACLQKVSLQTRYPRSHTAPGQNHARATQNRPLACNCNAPRWQAASVAKNSCPDAPLPCSRQMPQPSQTNNSRTALARALLQHAAPSYASPPAIQVEQTRPRVETNRQRIALPAAPWGRFAYALSLILLSSRR